MLSQRSLYPLAVNLQGMGTWTKRRTGDDGIAIAGGGLAGQRCAETLRRVGYERPIRLVCAEPHPPYDRPPLSKSLLTDPARDGELAFRPPEWYGEQSVDLLLGVAAAGLEPIDRRLRLSDGSSMRYERLLIATGGRPRTLPMLAGYDNVSVLRTLDHARRLRDVLTADGRLAIIGAGFIGLEVAATARQLGVEVTLVEAAGCPLEGVLGTTIGTWFSRLHAAEGVDIRPRTTIERVEGAGVARALALSDGSKVDVAHIVVGTGIQPDVGWLSGSGLQISQGVPVDVHGRTSIDSVFAAGDAAATFDPQCGRHVPGSHWEAAGRQGARAARAMLGLDPGVAPLTSFWTDQYGLRIHFLGRRDGADSVAIDGDLDSRNFSAIFSRAGRATAALLVDRPRFLPAARKLIEKGKP